jgi:hypothetical protein
VLLCVFLLAAGYGVFWLFENMSIGADGSVRVNLPGFASPKPEVPEPPNPADLVVVNPSGALSPTPAPTKTPAPTASPPPASPPPASAGRAAFVPPGILSDSAAIETFKGDMNGFGINTLVLDYKSNGGSVLSDEEFAKAAQAFGDGFKYVARLSVFLDDAAPRENRSWGVKHTEGGNWINTGGRWLNPFSVPASDYCLSLIGAAARLDVDGILLDNLCFPWYGFTDQISYGENESVSRVETINDFCARLDGLDIKVPIYIVAVPQAAEAGLDETAGQSLGALTSRFDAVYADYGESPPADSSVFPIFAGTPDEDFAGRSSFILLNEEN